MEPTAIFYVCAEPKMKFRLTIYYWDLPKSKRISTNWKLAMNFIGARDFPVTA